MDNKSKILAAAERLFDRHGFVATGMDKLSDTADVSSRTLYKHAGNKVALLSAVLDARSDRFMKAIDVASVDGLFDALEKWLSEEGMRGCMLLRAYAETGGEIPQIAETFIRLKTDFRKRIAAIVTCELGRSDTFLTEQLLVIFEGATVSAVYRGTEAVNAARSAAAALVAAARR